MSAATQIYEHCCDQLSEAKDDEDEEAEQIWEALCDEVWHAWLSVEEQQAIHANRTSSEDQ